MALDPARAQLVLREYRYDEESKDSSILARYPDSTPIEMMTNLDASGARALASELFTLTSPYQRAFTFTIEGLFYAEDFINGPNRYTLNFTRHPSANPSTIFTVSEAEADLGTGTTVITVHG